VDDANSRNQIIKALSELAGKQQIIEGDKGKFQINGSTDYFEGKLDMTTRKDGYVIVEELDDDVHIPSKSINKALDGDLVKIYVYKRRRNGKNEGEVVEIIKRSKIQFVGKSWPHK
jgi:ribonuclease R/exosome complex exonuclease DIS3/RRP44